MSHSKILFGGPPGAGKTTAISAASDIALLDNAAVDHGTITLDDGNTLHLYGTPGQARFDFMWEQLTEGAIALILLIDNSQPDALGQLHFHLGAFSHFIRSSAVAVGITHCDLGGGLRLGDYQAELQLAGFGCVPVFAVDPRSKRDVCLLIEAALSVLDPVPQA
jgi:signal recognition particle receptor subunit beta